MSIVAAAVVGGTAVLGIVSAKKTSDKASGAAEKGAQSAADATVKATELQIAEIQRQFDYQQRILLPQIQNQYNAQRRYLDMLGVGGSTMPEINFTPVSGYVSGDAAGGGGGFKTIPEAGMQPGTGAPGGTPGGTPGFPTMPAPGSSGAGTGQFVNPALDPTKLRDNLAIVNSVRDNRLATADPNADPYLNYLRANPAAAATAAEDPLVARANNVTMAGARGNVMLAQGAAGKGVYGDTFQASPGYAFQVEEMNRALDRESSAGGPNYSGAALMEAQRRARGLAANDFYNWAAGRTQDLTRLGAAEAQDAARGDSFAATDISRGDTALANYMQTRLADVARQDQGYQAWVARRTADVGRADAAAQAQDAAGAADLARSDNSYYAYLRELSGAAGFGGGPSSTAVAASGDAGARTAAAYGNEGGTLASIYDNLGTSQANIAYAGGAAINNAIQSGASNFITARPDLFPQPVPKR